MSIPLPVFYFPSAILNFSLPIYRLHLPKFHLTSTNVLLSSANISFYFTKISFSHTNTFMNLLHQSFFSSRIPFYFPIPIVQFLNLFIPLPICIIHIYIYNTLYIYFSSVICIIYKEGISFATLCFAK